MFRKHKPPFRVTIARGALESIFDECDQFDSHETGGRLIGSYERISDQYNVRLLGVIGPGPHAERSATSFFQDGEYQERIFRSLEEKLPEMEHLGNWHTHHVNGLATLSSGDKATYTRIVNHHKHNIDFFYALLVVRKTPSRRLRYQIKHYFFRRNMDVIYELADDDVQVVDVPAIWSRRHEREPSSVPAPPQRLPRQNANPERAKDQEFFTDFYPRFKPLFSARAGTFYWKGPLDLVDGTTVDVVAMETGDEGTCRYLTTAASSPDILGEMLKAYPTETFKSARHAIHHLKEWLNHVLYDSKKAQEAK